MPSNRHFWQGMEIAWQGEIVEMLAAPHGSIVYFDPQCARAVPLDVEAVSSNLYGKGKAGHYSAFAEYDVRGRFVFEFGEIHLKPTAILRRTVWITDSDKIREHLRRSFQKSRNP